MNIAQLCYVVFTLLYYITLIASVVTQDKKHKKLHDTIYYYLKIYVCLASLYLIYFNKIIIPNSYKHIVITVIISLLLSTLNFDAHGTAEFVKSKLRNK